MPDIVRRLTVEDVFTQKCVIIDRLKTLDAVDREIHSLYEAINGGSPTHLTFRYENHGEKAEERHVDRACWRYLVQIFELKRYMLCTEYEAQEKKIDGFDFPEFTVDNAYSFIDSLQETIYSNVRMMMKTVYANLCDGTYYTGSGYQAPKKKRNNNGIDKMFILTTRDYQRVFGYYNDRPSITDDLEKLCYVLDGKRLPELTIIREMHDGHASEWDNGYFELKVCKNGNTHYKIHDEIRAKLNLYGPEPGRIGEDIKIKVFERQ